MTPSEVLEGAADAIEKHGHRRGNYGSVDEGMCVLGAMGYAVAGEVLPFSALSSIHKAPHHLIGRIMHHVNDFVFEWSDNTPTQEVLDTLRQLAKEERLEEEGLTP